MNRNEKSIEKPCIIIIGGSFLNGINEKGLLKDNYMKIQSFPGETTETILNEVEELVKGKPDSLIVHSETNNILKDKNVLTNVKKVLKKVERCSPETQKER